MKNLFFRIIRKIRNTRSKIRIEYEKYFWQGKYIFPNSNTISQKIQINGTGEVIVGENNCFGWYLGPLFNETSIVLQARSEKSIIKIGNNCYFNNNVFVCSLLDITIGDDCLIGNGVMIIDFDGHSSSLNPIERKFNPGKISQIIIGNNVWIGSNVQILRGTKIGDNCIVAAGSVLNKNYKSNSYIGGVPAITFGKIDNSITL